ncbi:MAG: stage II sporulation protein M [Candidatus Bathyarchaeia archaeon]
MRFEIRDYLPREFIFSIVIAFIAFMAALIYGAWLGNQIPKSEAEEIAAIMDAEIEQLASQPFFIRASAIFVHNLLRVHSWLTLVPIIGWIWMLFVTYNTGFVLGTFAQMFGGDPVVRLLLALFALFVLGLPVVLFEVGAYVLLFAESLYVSYLALTKSGVRQRLRRHSWKTLLIYVLMLLIGALIESAMMSL